MKYSMKRTAVVVTATAALALSGCSGNGGGSGASGKSKGGDPGLILAISGPLSDPFFGASKTGADAAAEDLGLNYEYVAGKDFTDIVSVYKKLTEAAIGRKPKAIVIGNYFPDTLSPLIKKATDQGIAVVVTNSGRDSWRKLGAIGFVGEDPQAMGAAAAKQALKKDAKRGLCVNQVQGNPTTEARCDGYIKAFKKAGGSAKMLQVSSEDGQNNSKIQQVVAGALKSDRSVDHVFTLGAGPAIAAVAAVKQVSKASSIGVGTTDLSKADLQAVKDGSLDFVIDQQPFLQGYYGLLVASQYLKYGVRPAAEISTGPLVITKSNVDRVLEVGDKYPGIRGAS